MSKHKYIFLNSNPLFDRFQRLHTKIILSRVFNIVYMLDGIIDTLHILI